MIFDTLPNDPVMLLSFINTKLRDEYGSLDELCASLGADADNVKARLGAIGYVYDPKLNKFI
ncbi:MAG: DUF4250 domain-containing protein [Muribaculaceae bacterium]|nr:DUF4250 domain-containing protein [Muribaculaceae bacterium]